MIDLNPLHYVFNWTAVGSGVIALVAGHYHGKYNLSGKAWEKTKTFLTSEETKIKAVLETKNTKDIAANTNDIAVIKDELAAIKAKLTPPS